MVSMAILGQDSDLSTLVHHHGLYCSTERSAHLLYSTQHVSCTSMMKQALQKMALGFLPMAPTALLGKDSDVSNHTHMHGLGCSAQRLTVRRPLRHEPLSVCLALQQPICVSHVCSCSHAEAVQ